MVIASGRVVDGSSDASRAEPSLKALADGLQAPNTAALVDRVPVGSR